MEKVGETEKFDEATAHIETNTLNMRHQAQKGFRGIFVGIPQHQKGYLVYVPSTRKVISSIDVRFDESFVCHIYVFYFVHVLYGKLRRTLRRRR